MGQEEEEEEDSTNYWHFTGGGYSRLISNWEQNPLIKNGEHDKNAQNESARISERQ